MNAMVSFLYGVSVCSIMVAVIMCDVAWIRWALIGAQFYVIAKQWSK